MTLPLAGIRVADFSHVMAGPYATHLLRLLGAEVIKIEPPGRGDAMRDYGADRRYDGMAPAFIAVNAGKKSIALDLKAPQDLETARGIVARCDVLVENFRPGVMQRLGLGQQEMRAVNPRLIYCSISGYGQSGPRRDWTAIDNIVQATSGMMSLGGDPGSPPARVGFPVVDTLTGQTAAFAILSALLRRERGADRHGGGEYIDVAMFDATLAFMASAVVPWLVTGRALERTGNIGYSGQPTSALFVARDGRSISLGVVQQHQFVALARVLGHEEWLGEAAFADPESRRANADVVTRKLSAVFGSRDAAEWEALLSAHGIPCGMVREIGEAVSLPELEDRQLLLPLVIPGLPQKEAVHILGTGFRSGQGAAPAPGAPPRPDQHRQEILDWLAGTETPASGTLAGP